MNYEIVGGEGNTTYDKVFDAVWNNTFGKL